MLKLMYITNDPKVAQIAEKAGTDRIFIDLEQLGKQERQGGMDTVQSKHSISDIAPVRSVLKHAELLVRTNPIYPGSKEEIDQVIDSGADIVMLPFFQGAGQVETFLRYVDGRARTMLLVETPEAVAHIDEILALDGIDECLIGLNDLHLGYHMKFMFQLLADGTVETLCRKFHAANVSYGFGGIAAVGHGTLPAERIIGEHVRLGSSRAILSRAFCNTAQASGYAEIEQIFQTELPKIRQAELSWQRETAEVLMENHHMVQRIVDDIIRN